MTLSAEAKAVLDRADMRVANQESPITATDQPVDGKCCLRSGVATARVLKDWGIDAVSLANNHVFDHGPRGYADTCVALDQAGIGRFGAGENLATASHPYILDIRGVRIALLAFSWEFVQTTCATSDSAGCAPLDEQLMTEAIRAVAGQADAVVVIPHWGYCDYRFPLPEQRDLGVRLLGAGATAVVGHHSHVVQGVRREQDKLIAYSLGNFAFATFLDRGVPSKFTRDNCEGAILTLGLERGKVVSDDWTFTRMRGGAIAVDDSPKRARTFARRSAPLASSNYAGVWRRHVRRRMLRRLLYWANVLNWRKIRKGTFVGGWLLLKGIFARTRLDP